MVSLVKREKTDFYLVCRYIIRVSKGKSRETTIQQPSAKSNLSHVSKHTGGGHVIGYTSQVPVLPRQRSASWSDNLRPLIHHSIAIVYPCPMCRFVFGPSNEFRIIVLRGRMWIRDFGRDVERGPSSAMGPADTCSDLRTSECFDVIDIAEVDDGGPR